MIGIYVTGGLLLIVGIYARFFSGINWKEELEKEDFSLSAWKQAATELPQDFKDEDWSIKAWKTSAKELFSNK